MGQQDQIPPMDQMQFIQEPMAAPYQFQMPQPNPLGWNKDTLNQIINRRDPAQDIMDSLKGIHRDASGQIVPDYEIVYDERGEMKVNRNGQPIVRMVPPKPLMNSEGLEAFSALLKATLNQNVILTDFGEKHINSHCLSIVEAAIFDLENNYLKYGIQDTSQMDRIVSILMVSVHAALRSAREFGTLNHVTGMYQKTETPQPERKPGLFGMPGAH